MLRRLSIDIKDLISHMTWDRVRHSLYVLCFIVCVGAVLSTVSATREHAAAMDAADKRIEAAQESKSDMKDKLDSYEQVMGDSASDSKANSPAAGGAYFASYQNEYLDDPSKPNLDFNSSALVLGDGFKQPWLDTSSLKDNTTSTPISSVVTWRCLTTQDVPKGSTTQVVWICQCSENQAYETPKATTKDADAFGDVIAWATATYTESTNSFSDLVVKTRPDWVDIVSEAQRG